MDPTGGHAEAVCHPRLGKPQGLNEVLEQDLTRMNGRELLRHRVLLVAIDDFLTYRLRLRQRDFPLRARARCFARLNSSTNPL